jgi:general secretion pathway protein J
MNIKPQTGFTLIELLVATVIMAITSVMAYSGLNSVLKSHAILNKQQETINQLSQLVTQLQKEIRQIVARPVRDKYNTLLPALKLDSGTVIVFSFTRAGIPNPTGLQKNSLQRIDYIFNKQTLKKRIWLSLDSNNTNDYREETVADNLEKFKIEVLGFNNTLYPQWPLNRTDPVDILPKAVKFSFTRKESGEINRLVELPL